MEKVEQYIKEHTNRYSNHVELAPNITGFTQWLTIDDARSVAQIAREETINEVCEWIEENIGEYCDGENIMFSAIHIENIDVFVQEKFINDLKKYLENKA